MRAVRSCSLFFLLLSQGKPLSAEFGYFVGCCAIGAFRSELFQNRCAWVQKHSLRSSHRAAHQQDLSCESLSPQEGTARPSLLGRAVGMSRLRIAPPSRSGTSGSPANTPVVPQGEEREGIAKPQEAFAPEVVAGALADSAESPRLKRDDSKASSFRNGTTDNEKALSKSNTSRLPSVFSKRRRTEASHYHHMFARRPWSSLAQNLRCSR